MTSIGGVYHGQNAIFPLTATGPQVPGGSIMSGIFSQGRLGGTDESTDGVAAMCVDDAGDSSAPGTTVQLTTCQNDAEQNWIIEPDGTIQVNGMCLDTQGAGTAPGTLVVLGTCNASGTQAWSQGTGGSLVNQASGLCLDDPAASTTNNTPLQIATCTGSIEQAWPLPAAPASPAPPPAGSVYPTEEQHNGDVPCLDNAGGAAIAGSKVMLQACIGSKPQQWTMAADGTFQNFGMCLDTAGGGTTQGTLTVLNTCNGGSHPDLDAGTQRQPGQPGLRAVPGRPRLQHGQRRPDADLLLQRRCQPALVAARAIAGPLDAGAAAVPASTGGWLRRCRNVARAVAPVSPRRGPLRRLGARPVRPAAPRGRPGRPAAPPGRACPRG